MYVITGATGNTGKQIALDLLAEGKPVRIISRSSERSKELTEKGAELVLGNSDDKDLLVGAFRGASAVYAMLPMAMQAEDVSATRRKHSSAIAEALRESDVKYVVSLSSVGAEMESETGIVLDLHEMEMALNSIDGLHVLHLRASFFMENTLMTIGMVKEKGVMPAVLKSGLAIPAIATKDISDYALRRLLALDFEGTSVQYLLGQRDVRYPEMASVYGASIGKPDLQYVHIPYEVLTEALLTMGASASLAARLCEFFEFLNAGKLKLPERDAENTTPTSIEEFAAIYSHAYQKQ